MKYTKRIKTIAGEQTVLIARWENPRSKRIWVELYGTYNFEKEQEAFSYKAYDRSGGNLGIMNQEKALKEMEKKLEYLKPDAVKTPWERVK